MSVTKQAWQGLGKFASWRDEALYVLIGEGWANESTGDVEAPTGFFARTTIDRQEVSDESHLVLPVDLLDTEPIVTDGISGRVRVGRSSLVGHFLIREDDRGFITVIEFDSESELAHAYSVLEAEFEEWATEVHRLEDEDQR